jgi:hypothetical protein
MTDIIEEAKKSPIKAIAIVCVGLLVCMFVAAFVFGMSGNTSQSSAPISTKSYPTNSQSPTVSQTANYQAKVIYSGKWQGAMGDAGNMKSIAGTGTMTYDIQNPKYAISLNAQKMDDSSQQLTVQILKGGTVIKSEFTDAPYGVAQIVASI